MNVRKSNILIFFAALLCCAALWAHAQPVNAQHDYDAYTNISAVSPNVLPAPVAEVWIEGGYPYLSWTPVDGAVRYRITRQKTSSAFDNLAYTTETYYWDRNITSGATYRYRIYAIDADGVSSPYALVTIYASPPPTPSPTPVPTPDPFPTYPPIPDFSSIPDPTPAPALSIYNMAYNYYTVNDRGFYNRNGTVYASPPSFLNLGLVSNTVSLPVHFNYSNSLTNPDGYALDNHSLISVLVDIGSYTVGDTLNFSFQFDDLRALFALVSTDPGDVVADPYVAVTVWDHSANRVFWSSPSPVPFSQFLSGYSNSFFLDYDGISDLEFELIIIPDVNTDIRSGMYLDGSSVTFSLWSSLIDVTDPSIPVVNAVNNQTSFIGRFFSWLWETLSNALAWLGSIVLDGFDLIDTGISSLSNRISDLFSDLSLNLRSWFDNTIASVQAAAASVVDSVRTGFNSLIDYTGRLFIPSSEDLQRLMARIRDSVDPEDGSLLAFPHEIEMEILDILSRDYTAEPDPIVLQQFSMTIRGESYVVFPKTEIRLSTIFPSAIHRYVRIFGDLTLGMWILYLITNKVRKLLNLWYSED